MRLERINANKKMDHRYNVATINISPGNVGICSVTLFPENTGLLGSTVSVAVRGAVDINIEMTLNFVFSLTK